MNRKNTLQLCRNKKLVSIVKIHTDQYNDQDVGGFTLTFSNNIVLEIFEGGYECTKPKVKT